MEGMIKDYARQFAHRSAALYEHALNLVHQIITESGIEGSYERWGWHQLAAQEFASARSDRLEIPIIKGFFDKGMAKELSLFSGYPETVANRFQLQDVPTKCLYFAEVENPHEPLQTIVEDFLQSQDSLPELIIGMGCEDMAHPIKLKHCSISGDFPFEYSSQVKDISSYLEERARRDYRKWLAGSSLEEKWNILGCVLPVFDIFQEKNFGWEDAQGEHIEFFSPSSDENGGIYTRQSISGRTRYKLRIKPDFSVEIIDEY